jgi:branched-chain amino acid transport system substrate-binding protein
MRKGMGVWTMAALLVFALGAAPAMAAAPSGEPIKFGVSTAVSGDAAAWGKPFLDAIMMMANIINDEGGLLGRPVKVIYYDDKGSPDEALSVCKKLVHEDKVHVLQPGSTSGCIMTGMPIGMEAGIAQWGYGLAKEWLLESKGMIVRSAPPDEIMVAGIAAYATQELKAKTVSILHSDQFYGETAKNVFSKWFEFYGGKVLKVTSYATGDRDFSSQILALKQSRPEAVFVSMQGPPVPPFLEQFYQFMGQDPNLNLLGEISWGYPEVRNQAGDLINRVNGYFAHTAVKSNPDPVVQEWIKKVKERLNTDYVEIMARGICGMQIMREAITRAGTLEGKTVMRQAHRLKNFPTIMGPFTYDPRDGEGLKTGIVLKATAGKDTTKDKVVHTNTVSTAIYDKKIDFEKYFGKGYYEELLKTQGF